MMPDTPWAVYAACKNHPNPDLWFPSADGPGSTVRMARDAAEAKRICRSCPVQRDCLEYALVNEQWGIWGGSGEKERARIRRERARRAA